MMSIPNPFRHGYTGFSLRNVSAFVRLRQLCFLLSDTINSTWDLSSTFGWMIAGEIQPSITSFPPGAFRRQPALSENTVQEWATPHEPATGCLLTWVRNERLPVHELPHSSTRTNPLHQLGVEWAQTYRVGGNMIQVSWLSKFKWVHSPNLLERKCMW